MTVRRIGPGRWETRLRFGGGQRERFVIHATAKPEAEAREVRLIQLARRLARIDGAESRGILAAAASATEGELADVEAEVSGALAARSERGLEAATTFRQIAE